MSATKTRSTKTNAPKHRGMSFALTTSQVLARSKDVTRRLGWSKLKPGDRLIACEKCMGLKKGEQRKQLALIEIVSVTREPLAHIAHYPDDCAREGFPDMRPEQFIEMFCRHMKGCTPATEVNRVEFRYLESPKPE